MTTEEQSSPAGAAPEALLRPEVLAAFDRGFFEREGYWVWDGVLTDEGRRRWTATLQRLQGLNDSFLQPHRLGRRRLPGHGPDGSGSGGPCSRVPGLLLRRLRADAGHPDDPRPARLHEGPRPLRARDRPRRGRPPVGGGHARVLPPRLRRLHPRRRHHPPADDGALRPAPRAAVPAGPHPDAEPPAGVDRPALARPRLPPGPVRDRRCIRPRQRPPAEPGVLDPPVRAHPVLSRRHGRRRRGRRAGRGPRRPPLPQPLPVEHPAQRVRRGVPGRLDERPGPRLHRETPAHRNPSP